MRTSALRELRQSFPGAIIFCYVDPIGAEVLSLSEDRCRVVKVVNRSKQSRLLYLWRKALLHWSIRLEAFDLLVDLYNGTSSHRLLLTSKAKKVLMVRDAQIIAIPPSTAPIIREYKNERHLSNLYFSMLGHLDKPVSCPPDIRPWVDLGSVTRGCSEFDNRHYFVSLATGDPRKNLPFGLMRQLACWLYQERGLQPVIACNPGQERLQSEFEQHLSEAGIPYVRLGLVGLVDVLWLIRSVRFSILPDTGLFHLAVAAERPVLGIFTHTHPLHVDPFFDWVRIVFRKGPEAGIDLHGLPFGSKQIALQEVIDSLLMLLDKTEVQGWRHARNAS